MDSVLKTIERLAELAGRRPDPAPLDAGGVMERIYGLEAEGGLFAIPMRFFAGGAAAAAAAAIAVTLLAVTSWRDLSNPLINFDALLDVMDVML